MFILFLAYCLFLSPTDRSVMRDRGVAFVTDDIAEMLKNATFFPYNGLPQGIFTYVFRKLSSS